MKINRLLYSAASHPIILTKIGKKMRKYADGDYTEEERYEVAKEVTNEIFSKGHVKSIADGLENLPKEGGYVMFPNHQGKADTLAIIQNHEEPCSVVIDNAVCTNPFLNGFIDLVKGKRLEKDNLRNVITLFKEVEDEIINEQRRYIIFPEGMHDGNGNNLQEFHTGCMGFLYHAKCPIVPVCLYDTYKVYEVKGTGPVTCEAHFLKPIYYEEYKDLKKKELADLVKSRINEKLEELKKRES